MCKYKVNKKNKKRSNNKTTQSNLRTDAQLFLNKARRCSYVPLRYWQVISTSNEMFEEDINNKMWYVSISVLFTNKI